MFHVKQARAQDRFRAKGSERALPSPQPSPGGSEGAKGRFPSPPGKGGATAPLAFSLGEKVSPKATDEGMPRSSRMDVR